ncbi:MAG: response regulator [Verrucomicrobiota bacterium]
MAMAIRVSVVEDDAQARELLVGWINRSQEFQCASDHPSAEEALEAIPNTRPDIILMDINLPGMNGPECVRRLKPLLPDAQFVMVTIYEDSDHIFQALQAGATGYLLKQTERTELLAALRQVHAGGSPMTPNIARKVVRTFQQPQPQPPLEPLTELSMRENEILQLLAQGFLYKEIAEKLGIKLPTVDSHIRRIYEKLHVRSRSEAIARYAHLPIGQPLSRGLNRCDSARKR